MSLVSVQHAPAARPIPVPTGWAVAARQLRSVKILFPFIVLVAIWWAIQAAGNFPDRVLVSPQRVFDTMVLLISRGVIAEYVSTSLKIIGIATAIRSWSACRSVSPLAPTAMRRARLKVFCVFCKACPASPGCL
jgi:hypothetical protein